MFEIYRRIKFSILKKNRFLYFSIFISILLISACSTRKNKALNRGYHAMTARYNVYFNGEESFKEGLRNYEIDLQEDFDKILTVRKMGTEDDASSLFPAMERVIEKCTKGIKKHSMKIKGKERNIWIDNTFLLLGKAHFYKHDFVSAQTVFNHTTTLRDHDKGIDARIWSAECQVFLGNLQIAETNLEQIVENVPLDKDQTRHLLEVRAELYKRLGEYEAAAIALEEALELTSNKKKRARYHFIIGQLYQKVQEGPKAIENFKMVEKLSSDYELAFNALLYQAKAFDGESGDVEVIAERLVKMADDPKNADFLDQIYYALGVIYQNADDLITAKGHFETSLEKNVDNTNQLIRTHLSLGDLTFELKQYAESQAHFDAVMNLIDEDYPNYRGIKGKWNSLTELGDLYATIGWNDSIRDLYGLTLAEQTSIVQGWMEAWEEKARLKKEEEERRLQLLESKAKSSVIKNKKDGNNWYFSNPDLINSGRKLFVEKWGNRQREDNWRRSNKAKIEKTEVEITDEEVADDGGEKSEDKLNEILAQIPKDDEAMFKLLEENADAYYQLGMIYKEQLIDYLKSELSFTTVENDYKDYSRMEAVWYQLYRVYDLIDNQEQSDYYKNLLIEKSPESNYAKLAQNEVLGEDKKNIVQELYASAYQEYASANHAEAIGMADNFMLTHEKHPMLAKFALLRSLSLGARDGKEAYIQALTEVKNTYKDTEEADKASEILSVLEGNTENFDLSAYNKNLDTQYFFIAMVDRRRSKISDVTSEMNNFNRRSYKSLNLNIKELVFDDDFSLVSVKLFDGASRAIKYLRALEKSNTYKQVLQDKNSKIFIISAKNYTTFYKRKNIKEYEAFYTKYLAELK